MKKLRLIINEKCNRSCEGCCNRDWDIPNLPVCRDFSGYDIIMLTGGEPMLEPETVFEIASELHHLHPHTKVYLYTAKVDDVFTTIWTLASLDGMTVTLHDQDDAERFIGFSDAYASLGDEICKQKSMRLNVFRGVDIGMIDTSLWIVRTDIDWIKNCPLPKDEVLMKLSREM